MQETDSGDTFSRLKLKKYKAKNIHENMSHHHTIGGNI